MLLVPVRKMECRGRKVRITLSDDGGILEGFIHSMDKQSGRLSLEKVVNCESGRKLQGLQHFYDTEIEDIDVLEEYTISLQSEDEKLVNRRGSQSVMKSKYSPAHLSKLKNFDPAKLPLKNQGGDGTAEDGDHLADNEVRSNDVYTILAHLDNVFTEAISFIRKHQVIGVALEGSRLGRSGNLYWLQIGTPTHVFLFDVLTLGVDCFSEGLKGILEDENILKVFHDCRMASDILYHQFNIKIVNVFDTQVADVFIYRLRHHNDWPRFVTALAPCLSQHLDLSPEQVHWAIIRENFRKEDEDVWADRPMKKHVVEAAVKDVIYLLELRQVLMEKMLEEFVAGVNIYLSHVRDASLTDSEKYQSMMHLLPVAFQDVRRFMDSYRGRNPHTPTFNLDKDQHGFRENCSRIFQPDVNFSHDSLWHAGSVRRNENTVTEKPVSRSVIPDASTNNFGDSVGQRMFHSTLISQNSLETQVNNHKTYEPKLSKRDSFESQVNTNMENNSLDTGVNSSAHEPVDVENTDLSGSKLMRALVYNQEGNTRESDTEIDNFVLKPAGILRGIQGIKKKKSPQKPPTSSATELPTNSLVSEPRKEISASSVTSLKSYDSESNERKTIRVKNSDRFLQDYKHFIKKGNGADSESSDSEIIPGVNMKQPQVQSMQNNEQTESKPRPTPQYNFVPRGVLSQQEIELCNRRRKSTDSNKGDGNNTKGDADDNTSVCSDKTLSSEKDVQNSKLNPLKSGISLKSLLAAQKQFSVNGFHNGSTASSGSKESVPVSERMQALLDVIKKNQSK